MASGCSTKIHNPCNELDDINNNTEIVFDFSPKFTSTQALPSSKPATRRRKRPSGEPLCSDISNYWRRKKRNRLDSTKLGKGGLMMSEDGKGFYTEASDEARIDIVWADDDNNYLNDVRFSIVNLKPIQENKGPKESSSSDTGNDSNNSNNNKDEDEAALNQSRRDDIVLNDLITGLKIETVHKNDDNCDGNNNQPEVTESCKNSNHNPIESTVSETVHCDPDPIPSVITSSELLNPPLPDEIINCPSLDEDAFNDDDDDWLSQVPDDLLLKDSKAFVRKGEDGIISEALLRPRENVPIPTREEVLCKPNSQPSVKINGKKPSPTTIDQENKDILKDSSERKTIPNQNIRRSKLNFINDPRNTPVRTSLSRSSTPTNKASFTSMNKPILNSMNKPSSSNMNKQCALGEVTNTIKSQQILNQSGSKNQVQRSNTHNFAFPRPQVNQPKVVQEQKVIPEKKVGLEAPKSVQKDDEFIFDDDDDELFKNMDLDVIISTQTQPPPSLLQVKVMPEPPNETVPMEEEDDFLWAEEDDIICCSIDVSILN